jgi:rubrerythrin
MKLLNILEKLGDKSFTLSEEKSESRRESIFSIGTQGKTILKAVLPTGVLAAVATSGKAGNGFGAKSSGASDSIVDVLNFALTLEYLESAYYTTAVNGTVIPSADKPIFNQIQKHEMQHVAFLQSTIQTLGGTYVQPPTFDFTANGAFNPFGVYGDFLALSQAFEDTGVRAYKGQAGNLMSNDTVLQAALQIHSVEARHASEVRRLRDKNGFDTGNKGWISGNSRGTLPAATQPVYDGEDNTTEGGADAVAATTVGAAAVREAFDEPLTKDQVLAIANLFIHP